MHVRATTPNRIDLAGGTLDIYPLYLFAEGGTTVNLAIDVWSRVDVVTRTDRRLVLRSVDFERTVELDDIANISLDHELSLLARAVRFFAPTQGLEVTTQNHAPRGSGLGASSALLMALLAALAKVSGVTLVGDEIIDIGANLEAQNLAIPTGKQDYFGAVYGGLSAIHFGVRGGRHEALPLPDGLLHALREQLVVSFTGISHFSGTNNWAMTKRYIDREGDTVDRLHAIRDTAQRMREAALSQDVERLAHVLAEEWEQRKGLAEGVSTPSIDVMIEAAGQAGALASKLCGAGGGGCMVTVVRPGARQAVEQALTQAGAQVLGCAPTTRGLQLEVLEPATT
jgi:D-glycero-alpha-D-manno-heptose-7-phosphate kinase